MSHRLIAALSLSVCLMAGPALAGEWQHAAAPMGQFEGGISMEEGAYGITYGCAGSYGNLTFFAEGVHVAAGEGVVRIDGREVSRGGVDYNSLPDLTRYNLNAQYSYGPASWPRYNDLITALSGGTEAVWETPSGAVFTIPLTGSADIRSCLMR